MDDSPYDSLALYEEVQRVECRQCGVICERVVYPARCLGSGCRFIYAFLEAGVTYFGCMEGVFAAQLLLAPFEAHRRTDAYGGLKVSRMPRAECPVQIEKAYASDYSWQRCCNPTFSQHPEDYAPEAIRLLVEGPSNTAA